VVIEGKREHMPLAVVVVSDIALEIYSRKSHLGLEVPSEPRASLAFFVWIFILPIYFISEPSKKKNFIYLFIFIF
jgi:hypothetical protein